MISHLPTYNEVSFSTSGCFIISGGKFLAINRQVGKPYPKHWGIPTGKIEAGENPLDCIVRELEEELSLKVCSEQLRFVCENLVEADGVYFIFNSFALELDFFPEITTKADEIRDFQWIPLTSVRKRRVVPYFFNTLNDTLEWLLTDRLQLRLLPEPEVRHVKRIGYRKEGSSGVQRITSE